MDEFNEPFQPPTAQEDSRVPAPQLLGSYPEVQIILDQLRDDFTRVSHDVAQNPIPITIITEPQQLQTVAPPLSRSHAHD